METRLTQRGQVILTMTLTTTSGILAIPANTPMHLSLALTSADSTRSIALSFDGGLTYQTVSDIDFTSTTQIVVATAAPFTHVRATGAIGDILYVTA